MDLSTPPFYAKITAKASSGGFWKYSWTEQLPTAAGSAFADAPTGRYGDATLHTAYERNNKEVAVNTQVLMRLRWWSDGAPVYEFDAPDGSVTSTITVQEADGSPTGSSSTLTIDQATGVSVVSVTGGVATIALLAASATQMGAVTTGAQSFAGDKTFQDDVTVGTGIPANLTVNGDAGVTGSVDADTDVTAGRYLYVEGSGGSKWLRVQATTADLVEFKLLDGVGGTTKDFSVADDSGTGELWFTLTNVDLAGQSRYRIIDGATTYTGANGTDALGNQFRGGIIHTVGGGTIPTQYTDEMAQDAVGGILTDSATIDFTYDDAAPSITAVVKDGSITFAKMQAISANVLLGNDASGTTVEEIACTAAARTVLDDTTVAAMVDTLGGATSVGTGGLVRASRAVPVGAVEMFAGSSVPSGWLECDGTAVSRATYADLFTAIGTTWGSGDGSTTFNLPDLRGRAPIGVGTGSGLTARTLGGTGGAEEHTLNAAQMPNHTHDTITKSSATGFGSAGAVTRANAVSDGTVATSSTGSGSPHNNMQPWAALKMIIKT